MSAQGAPGLERALDAKAAHRREEPPRRQPRHRQPRTRAKPRTPRPAPARQPIRHARVGRADHHFADPGAPWEPTQSPQRRVAQFRLRVHEPHHRPREIDGPILPGLGTDAPQLVEIRGTFWRPQHARGDGRRSVPQHRAQLRVQLRHTHQHDLPRPLRRRARHARPPGHPSIRQPGVPEQLRGPRFHLAQGLDPRPDLLRRRIGQARRQRAEATLQARQAVQARVHQARHAQAVARPVPQARRNSLPHRRTKVGQGSRDRAATLRRGRHRQARRDRRQQRLEHPRRHHPRRQQHPSLALRQGRHRAQQHPPAPRRRHHHQRAGKIGRARVEPGPPQQPACAPIHAAARPAQEHALDAAGVHVPRWYRGRGANENARGRARGRGTIANGCVLSSRPGRAAGPTAGRRWSRRHRGGTGPRRHHRCRR